MIISWVIAQVVMVLYIRFAAWHHAPAVNAMREYVPTPNPYEDPFHTHAWFMAVVIALSISLGLLAYHPWWWCAAMGVMCGLWYWLLFDPWLNKGTGKKWYYLGQDSTLDRWLIKIFGSRAGHWKVIIITILIVLTNAARFIFN